MDFTLSISTSNPILVISAGSAIALGLGALLWWSIQQVRQQEKQRRELEHFAALDDELYSLMLQNPRRTFSAEELSVSLGHTPEEMLAALGRLQRAHRIAGKSGKTFQF